MIFDATRIDEWTLEECRDRLAIKAKYVKHGVGKEAIWTLDGAAPYLDAHPIPETLDEASKLSGSWCLESVATCDVRGDICYKASAINWIEYSPTKVIDVWPCSNEILARFRLRCKIEFV